MPYILDTKDAGFSQFVLHSHQAIFVDHPLCAQLRSAVLTADGVLPIEWVKASDTVPVDLEIRFLDGRVWRQQLLEDNNPDPLMNFTISDGFRLSEFMLYVKPVRDTVVSLIVSPDTKVHKLDVRPL